MGTFIFLTAEGSTYQPDSTSPIPDIENLQVIGFADGDTAQQAAMKLIEEQDFLVDTNFDEVFAIQIANENREYFYLKEMVQLLAP